MHAKTRQHQSGHWIVRVETSSDVFVVRGIWVNELSFDRSIRPFDHFYAITLRIVLNFVHDVVDEEHSTAGGSKQVCGIARIGISRMSKPSPSSSTVKAASFGDNSAVIFNELCRIVFVAVLDGVNKGLVESDEKIRTFRTNQTELRDALL